MPLFNGDNANNIINGTSEADTINGFGGADFLDGLAGNDSLDGGDGNDNLRGGSGNDTVNGGIGLLDLANYQDFGFDTAGAPTQGVTVNLSTGSATDNWGGVDTLIAIENVSGSALADTIIGDANANNLTGFAGNDTISGGDGIDFITGGAGTDSLDGGAGSDAVSYEDASAGIVLNLATGVATNNGEGQAETVINFENAHGSQFSDVIQLSAAAGYVFARAGSDSITGGTGNDNFYGGSGNDTLNGGAGTDRANYFDDAFDSAGATILGVVVNLATGTATDNWGGTDTLVSIENVSGSNFGDVIAGSAASNDLVGNGGDDSLSGGDGEDTLSGSAGNDTLNGGNNNTNIGFDFVNFGAATAGVTVNLALGTSSGSSEGSDVLISMDGVFGSNFDDTIIGTAGTDYIRGSGGNDSLDGGAGVDDIVDYSNSTGAIFANLNTGVATGAAGNDIIINFETLRTGSGNDSLTGNALNNSLRGNAGADTIDGGAGSDRADYLNAVSAVTLNLFTGTATGGDGSDILISIERLRGSNFNDLITGDNASNTIEGANGNDTVFGNDGGDFITAGLGDDLVDGGLNDIRQGTDWSNYSDAISSVIVNLTNGTATGGGGTDTLVSIDAAAGSAFGDTLTGDANFNFLRGNAGDDTIDGGAGFDLADYQNAVSAVTVNLTTGTSSGGDGNDTLLNIEGISASNFNDTLIGSAADERFRGRLGDDSIDGGGGSDTIDLRTSLNAVTINLALGTATGEGSDVFTNIENARGSELAADTLIGNAADNGLQGLGGNDTLDGGDGIDTAVYSVSYMSGVVANLATGVVSNDGWGTTDTLINIENLYGSQQADELIGSSIANKLEGDLGNDTLNGGAGNDTLAGGGGDDIYVVDSAADVVQENASEGTDIVYAYADFALTAGSHIDYLVGAAANGMSLTGNELTNGIFGTGFADTLNGGAGTDYMLGGQGSDIYIVDSSNDVVLENASEGTDVVYTYADFAITAGSDIDYLVGAAANGMVLTGNELTNGIFGTAFDDTLNGGAGTDYLLGGQGSDFYVVDSSGDVVLENASEGTDIVYAYADFALTAGSHIDYLVGAAANGMVLTGNELTNGIFGTGFADTLNGGAGVDYMLGGQGSDIYVVDSSGDVVLENASEGTDIVYAYADFALTAGSHIDYLVGAAANGMVLTGNELTNGIFGTAFDDTLNGGAGTDYMLGGQGSDIYVVDSSGDVVLENASEGTDIVYAYADFALTAGSHIDYLVGAAANGMVLTGNELTNGIFGTGFADTLIGGAGADYLIGGQGADTFAFVALADSGVGTGVRDNILDFVSGTDQIKLADIDANSGLAGDQAFTMINTAVFSGGGALGAGQLRYSLVGSDIVVEGDVDGDGSADFQVQIAGINTFVAGDFVL